MGTANITMVIFLLHFFLSLVVGQPVNCGDRGSDRQIICNYRPKTDVMEHWKLDLDQRDFQHFLGENNFTSAKNVYGKGANSMKTSEITLGTPLGQSFSQGASVIQG